MARGGLSLRGHGAGRGLRSDWTEVPRVPSWRCSYRCTYWLRYRLDHHLLPASSGYRVPGDAEGSGAELICPLRPRHEPSTMGADQSLGLIGSHLYCSPAPAALAWVWYDPPGETRARVRCEEVLKAWAGRRGAGSPTCGGPDAWQLWSGRVPGLD